MGDPSQVIARMQLKSAKSAIAELCEIILQNIQSTIIDFFIVNIKHVTHCSSTSWITFVHMTSIFVQKINACGVVGLSSIQKCTCAMCMLAYGQVVDAYNEYCRIGESSTLECLWCFVRKIKEVFEPYFLRTVPSGFLKVQFFFSIF